MAEFCLECWNKMNETNDDEKKYIVSEDLCDGCGEWKNVIVTKRKFSYNNLFFGLIYKIICFIRRIIILLCSALIKKK